MTLEHGENNGEQSFTQREILTISRDIYLGAVDLAEALALTTDRQRSTEELTIYRNDIPLHAIPDCWKEVNQRLDSIVVQYGGVAADNRLDLELRAYFDHGWTSSLTKPALTGPEQPFEGRTVESKSVFGPIDRAFGRPYQAQATSEEVAEFLSALIHYKVYQAEQYPLTDPMDATQARMVLETAEQTLTADVLRTDTFQLDHDGESYIIDCERSQGRIISVDVCHVLADDIIIEDGLPRELFHHIVGQIHLGNFEQGIRFYIDSEDGFLPEDEVTDEMLASLKETIDTLNEAIVLPESLIVTADSAKEASQIVRDEKRWGRGVPDIDESDEDGLDSTDSGA